MSGRYHYQTSEQLRLRDLSRALWAIYDLAAQGAGPALLQQAAWIAIERDGWAERHDAQPRRPHRAEVA